MNFEPLLNNISATGGDLSLRSYPFDANFFPADPDGTETVVRYQLETQEDRLLLAMVYSYFNLDPVPSPDDGGGIYEADKIDLVARHDTVNLIIPQTINPLVGAPFASFHTLSHYSHFVSWSAGASIYIQGSGFVPLMRKIGPGGVLEIGGRVNVGGPLQAKIGLRGVIHSIKL